MRDDTGPGPAKQQLGTTYSVILGVLGLVSSILALVQLVTTENTLVITLLLAAVLGLAAAALHYTWHADDSRLRWLGSLMVAVLTLTSFGGGYGLGRATAPATTPSAATPARATPPQAVAGAPADTTPSVITTSADGVTAVATTRPVAGALPLARATPATTDTYGKWQTGPVSVETVEYDEAIVLLAATSVFFCDVLRYTEYVLGRRYKRLTGRVALADDSANTKSVPLVVLLDGEARVRKNVTTAPLRLDVDLTGVNRVRFELTPPGNCYEQGSKVGFVELTAQP